MRTGTRLCNLSDPHAPHDFGTSIIGEDWHCPGLDPEQVVYEEGYEAALRDVILSFDRTEEVVGEHAQPRYWYGAKQVVRSLMTHKQPTPDGESAS